MIPGLEEWNWCIHTELNFLGCYDWQKTRISEGVEVWFQLRERLKNGRENNKPKIPKLSCGNLQNSRFQFCTHIYKHTIFYLSHIQTCSVQSLDQLGHQGVIRDNLTEILSQAFLHEALVSNSGMGRDVHSLMLSIQHFLCQPWHHPPSKVP